MYIFKHLKWIQWIKSKIIHRVINSTFFREIAHFRSFPQNPQCIILIILYNIFIYKIMEVKKMKIICERETLLKGINTVVKAVAAKTTTPILEGILIQTDNNKLKLTTYDKEIGIEYIADCQIIENGNTVVNSTMFSEIVRKLPSTEINIELNKNNLLVIECEGSLYKLSTMNPDEFPEIPKINVEQSIETSQTVLKELISKTIFAVSIEENRPIFTGCLFEVVKNRLNVVAIDGFRMGWVKDHVGKKNNGFKVVIPGKTLNEVNKILLDSFDDIKIGVEKNQAVFEMENCKIVTRLLEGEFLNYASVIPANWETRIKISRDVLKDCFERIILISNSTIEKEKKYPVKINIEIGKITISCTNQLGDAKEELYLETEGKELEIGVNPKYFLDALKVIDDEEIYIEFGTNISPCVLRSTEENAQHYVYMILPVRMKED
jgi:DNA polymerase-3 subunit beta